MGLLMLLPTAVLLLLLLPALQPGLPQLHFI